MIYLEQFTFPDRQKDEMFCNRRDYTRFDRDFYPAGMMAKKQFSEIDFDRITILYGGNGSGKSTALNLIAEKLGIGRKINFNSSRWLPEYAKLASYQIAEQYDGMKIVLD